MNTETQTPPAIPKRQRRGFMNPSLVRGLSFATITICIIISVIACILAIWDFTKQDTLWRTVATCVVVAGGVMAFGVINTLYGPRE